MIGYILCRQPGNNPLSEYTQVLRRDEDGIEIPSDLPMEEQQVLRMELYYKETPPDTATERRLINVVLTISQYDILLNQFVVGYRDYDGAHIITFDHSDLEMVMAWATAVWTQTNLLGDVGAEDAFEVAVIWGDMTFPPAFLAFVGEWERRQLAAVGQLIQAGWNCMTPEFLSPFSFNFDDEGTDEGDDQSPEEYT